MCAKINQQAQNPLILRCHRLMEAFAKSDDERDFYIDRVEGFLIYVDLDKPQTELESLDKELKEHSDRYCIIPKLSFYETKKIMESFVNEKVYDIDTKEKLLDIIQSKEARENFLEFIYDHHAELEKWQQFYQERSRIRIIEWLRLNHFHFVFEEDLDLPRQMVEKLKQSLFQPKVSKEIQSARKLLIAKAKTYYSNEALNPRPKRGRPPKQAAKPEIEPQVTIDIYTAVPPAVRSFLFTPEISLSSAFSIFSSKFETEDMLTSRQQQGPEDLSLNQKLASLRSLSSRWMETTTEEEESENAYPLESVDEEEDLEKHDEAPPPPQSKKKKSSIKVKSTDRKKSAPAATPGSAKSEKPKTKRIMPKIAQKKKDQKPKMLKKLLPENKS